MGLTRSRMWVVAAAVAACAATASAVAAARGGVSVSAAVANALAVIEQAGPYGPLLFALVYIVAAVGFVPASVFTMAAGALFGLLPGVAIVYVAAFAGASISFFLSRGVGRQFVERHIGRDPRIAAVDRAVAERGLTVVFLLRLSPLIPFGLLNYALGLTRVRYRDFALGSVGMIPAVFMYVSAGAAAGELVAVISGARAARSAGSYILLGVGLIATIVATWMVTRLATRALREGDPRG